MIDRDATQTFELKLYNVDGLSMDLSLVDLDIQGTLPNGDIAENLYASMPTAENPVSYEIM